jgi:hypothetical protein
MTVESNLENKVPVGTHRKSKGRPDYPEEYVVRTKPHVDSKVRSSPSSEVGITGIMIQSYEKALLRKIDWRLLPAVGILYLLSFLDRSNVGNARIEGLAEDIDMTGNQYLTGLTLYFVGYVLFEVRTDLEHSHDCSLARLTSSGPL